MRERGGYFAFVGDSRVRQLFDGFVNRLNPANNATPWSTRPKHHDIEYRDYGELSSLHVHFYWAPMLDGEAMAKLTVLSDRRPVIVVVGAASWPIKDSRGSDEMLESFRRSDPENCFFLEIYFLCRTGT